MDNSSKKTCGYPEVPQVTIYLLLVARRHHKLVTPVP